VGDVSRRHRHQHHPMVSALIFSIFQGEKSWLIQTK
jgi:hypothetical protein